MPEDGNAQSRTRKRNKTLDADIDDADNQLVEGAVNASLRDEQSRSQRTKGTDDEDGTDIPEYECEVLKSRQPGGPGTAWQYKVRWVPDGSGKSWPDQWISGRSLGKEALKAWMKKNGGHRAMQEGAYSCLPYRAAPVPGPYRTWFLPYRTVPVPYLYRTCTVPVPYLYRTCTVPYLYRTCTVPVPYLYRTCTVPVPYLYRTCTVPVPYRTCTVPVP